MVPEDNWGEKKLLLPFLQHVEQSGNYLCYLLYLSGNLHFVHTVQLVSVDRLSQQTEYFAKELSPVNFCNRNAVRFALHKERISIIFPEFSSISNLKWFNLHGVNLTILHCGFLLNGILHTAEE